MTFQYLNNLRQTDNIEDTISNIHTFFHKVNFLSYLYNTAVLSIRFHSPITCRALTVTPKQDDVLFVRTPCKLNEDKI